LYPDEHFAPNFSSYGPFLSHKPFLSENHAPSMWSFYLEIGPRTAPIRFLSIFSLVTYGQANGWAQLNPQRGS